MKKILILVITALMFSGCSNHNTILNDSMEKINYAYYDAETTGISVYYKTFIYTDNLEIVLDGKARVGNCKELRLVDTCYIDPSLTQKERVEALKNPGYVKTTIYLCGRVYTPMLVNRVGDIEW